MRAITNKRSGGFTLVEILVTVAIIGVLAAIAVPIYNSQRNKAAVATAQEDARSASVEVLTILTEYTLTGGSGNLDITNAGTVLTVNVGTGYAPSSLSAAPTGIVSLSPNSTLSGSVKPSSATGEFCIKITSTSGLSPQVAVANQTGVKVNATSCTAGVAS